MENMTITMPAIRIKLTGTCNRTCSFCHEEGDMKNIKNVIPNDDFYTCIDQIMKKTAIGRIMLTGGEPTIHPEFMSIVSGLSKLSDEISVTTNGIKKISVDEWSQFKNAGLTKVVVSIHDTSAKDLLSLESIKKNLSWAENALENQFNNVKNIVESGIDSRINIVAYGDFDKTLKSVKTLLNLQKDRALEIRLLNNLVEPFESQEVIEDILKNLGASKINGYQRAGSSNVTNRYITSEGKILSVKIAFPYYLNSICSNCPVKDKCYEGFYGVRVERIMNEYYVRLCIYKQTTDVLIPWMDFINSPTVNEIQKGNVII